MEDPEFRQQFLDVVCRRRVAITFAFVVSGLLFFVAVAIIAFADVSRASRSIAIVDAGVSGVILVASAALLRACNRFQRRQ